MKKFRTNDRVRIISMDAMDRSSDIAVIEAQALMAGRTGTVRRLLMRDISAWVQMDDELPPALASFPADDPRGRNLILWPSECDPENRRKENTC